MTDISPKSFLAIVLAALVLLAIVKLVDLKSVQVPFFSSFNESPDALDQIDPISQNRTPSSPIDNRSRLENASIVDESLELVDYTVPSCGDGVCDAGETCSTCSDCACSNSSQLCSLGGICVEREVCGDIVCTSLERSTVSCCTDCNCSTGTLCNGNTQACMALVQLTPVKLNESIAAALLLPGLVNYTFYRAYDDYYGDKIVKVIALRCPGNPDFDCEAYVYVDASGRIIGTDHTT